MCKAYLIAVGLVLLLAAFVGAVEKKEPSRDEIKLRLAPQMIMWHPMNGISTMLTVSVENPTGRFRQIIIFWGDEEKSGLEFFYGEAKDIDEYGFPDRVTERQWHNYKRCRPQIVITVAIYAILFKVAWVDNGGHVIETQYPGEVDDKVSELEAAGFPYHVTADKWLRTRSQNITLRVSGCH